MTRQDCMVVVTRAIQSLDPKAKAIVDVPRRQVYADTAGPVSLSSPGFSFPRDTFSMVCLVNVAD